MSRRFIFRQSTDRTPVAPATHHPSGFGIVASESREKKETAAKMAETTQDDIRDAREWLKRQGLDEAVAMFDASVN